MRQNISTLSRPSSVHRGFTIVELLIVIVVIAILAALSIVGYNGIRGSAIEASLKSDLKQAASTLENDKTLTNSYPVDSTMASSGQGLRSSEDNSFTYHLTPYGYCLQAEHADGSGVFSIRSSQGTIQDSTCDAVVTTFAGSGGYGYVDDTGTAAQFLSIWGVAFDDDDNLYVTEGGSAGSRIRKITPEGEVTTLAGSTNGHTDATGTAARFNYPRGIDYGEDGYLYVADSGNHRIRKVSLTGEVTTLAGSGTNGYLDATGTAAQFNFPNGIAVNSAGTVYVLDSGTNRRVRVVSPAGVVTTLAGSTNGNADGTGSDAQFGCFNGDPALDSVGNLYVPDACSARIRKVTPEGVVTTIAGSTGGYLDGISTVAQFNSPSNLTIDSQGVIYVSEVNGAYIRKITPDGIVSTLAGDGQSFGSADGVGTAAQFFWPYGIDFDSNGVLHLADSENFKIRKITL